MAGAAHKPGHLLSALPPSHLAPELGHLILLLFREETPESKSQVFITSLGSLTCVPEHPGLGSKPAWWLLGTCGRARPRLAALTAPGRGRSQGAPSSRPAACSCPGGGGQGHTCSTRGLLCLPPLLGQHLREQASGPHLHGAVFRPGPPAARCWTGLGRCLVRGQVAGASHLRHLLPCHRQARGFYPNSLQEGQLSILRSRTSPAASLSVCV